MSSLGGFVGLDVSGDDAGLLTAEANHFDAGAFIALTDSGDPGIRCAYFSSGTFRSESGLCLAMRLTESLRTSSPTSTSRSAGPTGSCARRE